MRTLTSSRRGASRRPITPGRGRLVWLLVIAETAALIAVIAVALHYRAEAVRPGHRSLPPAGQGAPVLPGMTSVVVRLPATKPIAGTVFITAAQPGGERG